MMDEEKPKSWDECFPFVKVEAEVMALELNGGSWADDYTEAQKFGWALKVIYGIQRWGGEGVYSS